MSRATLLILIGSALALVVAIIGGVRHDYVDYLNQWQLVLNGTDPWATNNAYGPLHNAFAWLTLIHPLAPKLVTLASLLAANALLLRALISTRPAGEWLANYAIVFGGNFLVLITALWFGLNDAFVAALVLGAILARHTDRMLLAGLLLGLATLDKYYPALLIPFFALDARRIEPRLLLAAFGTIALGIVVAIWVWGSAWFEAVAYGVSRDATLLSIFHPIAIYGRLWGFGEIADTIVKLHGPLVLLVWIGSLVGVWLRRDNWLVGACWGFLAVLLTYKVGHQQFWTVWLTLVAALPLLNTQPADRLARLSWIYASFLSLFTLGFVVLQPQYYQGQWHWIDDIAGLPNFVLGAALLWLYLRPSPRPAT